MKSQILFTTGNALHILLAIMVIAGFILFIRYGASDLARFMQGVCERYPELFICGSQDVSAANYKISKKSTEALACAINTVAQGAIWGGDGKIDCQKYYAQGPAPVAGSPSPADTGSAQVYCDINYEPFEYQGGMRFASVAFAGLFADTGSDFSDYASNPDKYRDIGISLGDPDPCEQFAKTKGDLLLQETADLQTVTIEKNQLNNMNLISKNRQKCTIEFDMPLVPKDMLRKEGNSQKADMKGEYLKVMQAGETGSWSVDITGDDTADTYLTAEQLLKLGVQGITGATLPQNGEFHFTVEMGTANSVKIAEFQDLGPVPKALEIPMAWLLGGIAKGNIEPLIKYADQISVGQTYTVDRIRIIEASDYTSAPTLGKPEPQVVTTVGIDYTGDGVIDNNINAYEKNIDDVNKEYRSKNKLPPDGKNSGTARKSWLEDAFGIKSLAVGQLIEEKIKLKLAYDHGKTFEITAYSVRTGKSFDVFYMSKAKFLEYVNSGKIRQLDLVPSSKFIMYIYGFPPEDSYRVCEKLYQTMRDINPKTYARVREVLAYRKYLVDDSYIPAPIGFSAGTPVPGSDNEYPEVVKTAACKFKKSKATCNIKGFNLPQDVTNAENAKQFVAGLGDPEFIVYYEAFPEGEESAWIMESDDFLVASMVMGGVVNMIPVVGKLAGKAFTKVIGRSVGDILKTAFGKLLVKFGLRKASELTAEKAFATLSDDALRAVLKKRFGEKLDVDIFFKLGPKLDDAVLKRAVEADKKLIIDEILKKLQAGKGPDEITKDLLLDVRLIGSSSYREMGDRGFGEFVGDAAKKNLKGAFEDVVKSNADDVAKAITKMKTWRGLDQTIDGLFSKDAGSFADDFFKPLMEKMTEDGIPEAAAKSALLETFKNSARKATIKDNLQALFKTAAKKYNYLPEPARKLLQTKTGYIAAEYVTQSKSLRYFAIEAMDEAGILPDAAELEGWGVPKELAQCFLLVPGKGLKGRTACLALQAAAIVMEIGDKQNEKYGPHNIDSLTLHRTIWDEDIFSLAPAEGYYVQLVRPQNIWSGGGPQRLFFASPCKADLKVQKEMTECAVQPCEYKSIAKENCNEKTGTDYEKCEQDIKDNVCGHLAIFKQNLYFLLVKGQKTEDTFLTKYPFYFPSVGGDAGVEMGAIDREVYPEYSVLPDYTMAVKQCYSMSMMEGAWNTAKQSALVGYFSGPPNVMTKMTAIQVEPDASTLEGFCFQGDDHKEFWLKAAVIAGSAIADIGIAALSAATGGIAAPLFFVTGAGAAYLDRQIEKLRMWPSHK
jgi:hypothetical protein